MTTWSKWEAKVRREAHRISVQNYNGQLVGPELAQAIVALCRTAAEKTERAAPPALHIARGSYRPQGAIVAAGQPFTVNGNRLCVNANGELEDA